MNLLKHKEEGFVYQSDAPYMLSFYIKNVFAMEDKATEIGLRAKQHAKKTHNRQKNLDTLLGIYDFIFTENAGSA